MTPTESLLSFVHTTRAFHVGTDLASSGTNKHPAALGTGCEVNGKHNCVNHTDDARVHTHPRWTFYHLAGYWPLSNRRHHRANIILQLPFTIGPKIRASTFVCKVTSLCNKLRHDRWETVSKDCCKSNKPEVVRCLCRLVW